MPSYARKTLIVLLCLSAVTAGGLFCDATAQSYTIAVVSDGSGESDAIVQMIEEELKRLLEAGVTAELKLSADFDANWDPGRMKRVIENAMRDPSVDFILGTGLLVTQEAARTDFTLTKPFVSCFDLRHDLLEIPISRDDGSPKNNLSFMVVPHGIDRDVATFQSMIPFDTLHVVLNDAYVDQIDTAPETIARIGRNLGLVTLLVPVGADYEPALPSLSNARAVLLAHAPRLPADRRRALIKELTARGIPTFSATGYADVEAGALASDIPDMTSQIIRRAALNLNLLMRGVPVGELPVTLQLDSKLLINGRTATAVGYRPNNVMLTLADFLYRDALQPDAVPLSFRGALAIADTSNIELRIKDTEVEISLRDKQRARSPLLPQIRADGGYTNIEPFVEASIIAREAIAGGITFSQMIYDDELVSNFRSSGRIYESELLDREARRLDIYYEAGSEFLRYVLARILYQIAADNVRLTSDNLDLSKVRYDVGISGQDEVFRWQAQLSSQQADLFASATSVEQSRIFFNRVLGVNQNRVWIPEEISVDADVFPFLEGRLDDVFGNPVKVARLRDFVVKFSQTNAPELQFFDKALEAQEIQVGQRTRTFFVPKFRFEYLYDYQFKRVPEPAGYSKDLLFVALEATYPIFNGGDRFYDRRREQARLVGLKQERERTRQDIERRARAASWAVQNSFPTIKLTRDAADNAHDNLEIVQDKYAQGIVNVITLLDAQNQSFITDQAAVGAVYSFLLDLVEFQRAIAWFEAEKTEEDKDALARQIETAVGGQ